MVPPFLILVNYSYKLFGKIIENNDELLDKGMKSRYIYVNSR